jgi:hypothetical protein
VPGSRSNDVWGKKREPQDAAHVGAADPFVISKLRSFEVREWTVMEGSFGVTVNFSDQSMSVA